MEFRQLEAFVAVAEKKSFSLAADALYLSQSTVSSHVKNLEKELKRQLIVRTTKSLRLTPEGETFLRYAKRIVETRDAAITAVSERPQSMLRLGASSIPSAFMLPEIIRRFQAGHPDVVCVVRQGDSRDIHEMLQDGTVDVGFLGQEFPSTKCGYISLCADRLVLAAPASDEYRRMKEEGKGLREILKSPYIQRERGSGTEAVSEQILRELGMSPTALHIVAGTNDLQSLTRMIEEGVGISICSELAVREMAEQGRLLTWPLNTVATRSFYIAYCGRRKLSPLQGEFIDGAVQLYHR
ncbi:MAG: LysR family transcriptional regulator [Lachnospiraceae bacterium]|nr:LysR family transcriptional regulator [Lachnospiraceae bacterium]